MKKRKALGVGVAVAVVVAFGVVAKEQVTDKVAPFGLSEEKVYLEQVGEVLWTCGASFDGQRRDILLKIAPGRGVFYSANADDPHVFFSGEFNISGRNFHFDYSMLNHAGRGSELVSDGSPGAFTWDGMLKKLDNGEMNFEATEKVIYEGRPVISKIVAKCKSLSAPAKSLASPQVAPQPPIVTKPTASDASPVVTEAARAADAAGAKPVAPSDSSSESAKEETPHSGQMVVLSQ